jgi:3-methylcrotonyl-CoA carboxylase alpha subunit
VTRIRCGENVHEVTVRESRDGLLVVLDGETSTLGVEQIAAGSFVVRSGDALETFHCVRAGDTIHLWWRGETFVLDQEVETSQASRRHRQGGLEAPMPGKVIAVEVEVGDTVGRGDPILVVEAMKMENVVRAPRDGTVSGMNVAVGDTVAPGRILVELE